MLYLNLPDVVFAHLSIQPWLNEKEKNCQKGPVHIDAGTGQYAVKTRNLPQRKIAASTRLLPFFPKASGYVVWQVSWLGSLRPPSHANAQWLNGRTFVGPYSCGNSTGFSPVSLFIRIFEPGTKTDANLRKSEN